MDVKVLCTEEHFCSFHGHGMVKAGDKGKVINCIDWHNPEGEWALEVEWERLAELPDAGCPEDKGPIKPHNLIEAYGKGFFKIGRIIREEGD